MEGPAAATCIATVNSVGNLGGLIGPFMIGEAKHCGACHDCNVLVLLLPAASVVKQHLHGLRGYLEHVVGGGGNFD